MLLTRLPDDRHFLVMSKQWSIYNVMGHRKSEIFFCMSGIQLTSIILRLKKIVTRCCFITQCIIKFIKINSSEPVSAHSNALHNKQTTDNGFIFLKNDHDLFFILYVCLKRLCTYMQLLCIYLTYLEYTVLIYLCHKYIYEIKTL